MYKIAVIGDRDSIYGFAALGIATFPVISNEEAVKTLRHLAESEYAVIYVTEAVQKEIATEIDLYKTELIPAIIPIPGVNGNTGIGMENVKRSVERAVGSDIIFNNEN
jgi:V/A-type H+/Na+-transporting ATPase subunit F